MSPRRARYRRPPFAAVVAVAAVAALCSAPHGAAGPASDTHVVVITIDTLRADRLSIYGCTRATSPHLDRLLAAGARFTRAYTIEPLTNPALTSMLTGAAPHVHGATRNGIRMLDGLESWPKIMAREGWQTAAVVSNWTLKDSLSRLGEHFDDYIEVFTRKRWFGMINSEATASDVTDEAIDWTRRHIAASGPKPFMLWVHYVEPHAPYRFHREFAGRLGIEERQPTRADRYDTEIAAVDDQVGRLVDWLTSKIDPAKLLIVFSSDHGESLGEHGDWGHGRTLYWTGLDIPMGIVWQGRIPPGTIDAPALIIDLPVTVLDLLGLPAPDGFVGASWAASLTGGPLPQARTLCVQAHRGAVKGDHDSDRARSKGLLSVGIIRDQRKEILRVADGSHLEFDRVADPGELHDLAPPDAPASPELMRCVGEISQGLGNLDRLVNRALDPEDIERLRALGYLD